MKKATLILGLIISHFGFAQITDTGNKVGIGTTNPYQKLHVNGDIGVGLLSGTYIEGLRINYVDGGSGTTTFKSNRWGGNIYFKRNSSQGERTQFLFGGAGEHYMSIYNSNNEVKVRFNSGGNSYINGGNIGIGTTTPNSKLEIKDITNNQLSLVNSTGNLWQFRVGNTGSLIFKDDNIERIRVDASGNVSVGTTDAKGFKLGVQGKIVTEEVKVATYSNWADFVFESNYNLPTLKEVEQHIKEKGHLKDIPSAEEVKKDGFFLGEMDSKLLQKIEELTLYTIEQHKEIEAQNNKIEQLENKNNELKSLSERLTEIEKLLSNTKHKQ